MFYNSSRHPGVERLTASWREMYAEYLDVSQDAVDWHQTFLHGQGWKVFPLFNFPNGARIETSSERCPKTARLIEETFPNHGAGGYSILAPGTRIIPHTGYDGEFLRCHVGLKIPAGDCGLRVGSAKRQWGEGEALIFDDRYEHDAWNETNESRVVLLVDFVPSDTDRQLLTLEV